MTLHRSLPLMCLLALGFSLDASAQEWTRFRGPNGTGISDAKTIPSNWTEKDIQWKTELPGQGHSSPVLWGTKLFITGAEEKAEGCFHAICVNANDGKILWKKDYPLPPFKKNKLNTFASSTPTVDAERVYFCHVTPEHFVVTALTHDGKNLWDRDLGPFLSQHGFGSSPIVHEDKLILGNEQDGESFVTALDVKTGKTRWQTPRRTKVAAYSTPCIFQPAKAKPQLIFNSQAHGVAAVDPDTGAALWEFPAAFDKRSVSSPFIAGGLIFGSCGSGGGGNFVSAVKPGPAPELAWQLRKSAPYVPAGVACGGYVYFWSDGGVATCVQTSDGQVRWQERIGGNFYASPICVDGRIFNISTTGEVIVIRATPEKLEELSRFQLNERSHSTPAVALGKMFVRTESHLFCVGSK